MKMIKWLAIIAAVLAAVIAVFLGYMGMFSAVIVSEQQMGPYTYAYEEFTGPYKDTMPAFDRVNNLLKAEGLEPVRGIGVYFDNPSQVAADKLRSNCGSIIEEKDMAKLQGLSQKAKIGSFALQDCVVVVFPIKNPLSYFLAPMKVYPHISKYMESKGYKPSESYEIYDMQNKKTYYILPVKK